MQRRELEHDVQDFLVEEAMARDSLQKADIRKKAAEKKKQLDRLVKSYEKKKSAIWSEAESDISTFDSQLDIHPLLLVNIVLKF